MKLKQSSLQSYHIKSSMLRRSVVSNCESDPWLKTHSFNFPNDRMKSSLWFVAVTTKTITWLMWGYRIVSQSLSTLPSFCLQAKHVCSTESSPCESGSAIISSWTQALSWNSSKKNSLGDALVNHPNLSKHIKHAAKASFESFHLNQSVADFSTLACHVTKTLHRQLRFPLFSNTESLCVE